MIKGIVLSCSVVLRRHEQQRPQGPPLASAPSSFSASSVSLRSLWVYGYLKPLVFPWNRHEEDRWVDLFADLKPHLFLPRGWDPKMFPNCESFGFFGSIVRGLESIPLRHGDCTMTGRLDITAQSRMCPSVWTAPTPSALLRFAVGPKLQSWVPENWWMNRLHPKQAI